MGFKLAVEVQTELNSSWEAGVIAKPAFVNKHVNAATRKVGTLYLEEEPGSYEGSFKTSTPTERIRNCTVIAVASSEANLEKYLEQIQKHIAAKAVTSGHWTLGAWEFSEHSTKFMAESLINEHKWVLPEAW
jgi:hypothetical protein